jgi:integrase
MTRKRGRRANGDGGFKIRKDGSVEARLTLTDGTRKSIYGRNLTEARKNLDAAKADRDKGIPVLKGKGPTVTAFLEGWLAMKKEIRSYRTWKSYFDLYHLHIGPALGHITLSRLTAPQVQHFYTTQLQAGLSPTTVKHMHAALHDALGHALKQGLVLRNVCDLVEAPQFAHVDRVTLSANEAWHLMETARGSRWYVAIVLALTAGMREGEMLGLRWRYVDLDRGVLTVSGNAQPGVSGLVLKEPKNRSSIRQIKLTTLAVEALREHQALQAIEREQAGDQWQEMGLVCPTVVGTPVRSQNFVTRGFRPLAEKAGIPRVRFHDLRHTHATLLTGLGTTLPLVSGILGHSSIQITGDLYTHTSIAMQEPVMKQLDALFRTSKQ